jgi:hypothetical protein
MKTQEQIIFENVCLQLLCGEYRNHPLESIGNILHYLRAYGLHQYDTCQIGWRDDHGQVHLWGKVVATFTIDYDRRLPVFIFDHEHEWLQRRHDTYLAGLPVFVNPYEKYVQTKSVKV